jgi:hypothetical protein
MELLVENGLERYIKSFDAWIRTYFYLFYIFVSSNIAFHIVCPAFLRD